VDAPERELYDQAADPLALKNLAPSAKAVADTMQAQSDRFHRQTKGSQVQRTALSPEQSEDLRALGYVGTDSSAAEEGQDRGPDPKGKTAIADLLDQGLVAIQEQEFEAAIPKLQEVLKVEPNTALAYLELGRAYLSLKDYQRALPPLRIAVEKLPQDGLARLALGQALVETGNWTEAAPEFEAALVHNPSSPELHFSLAVVYERAQRFPEAMNEFREAIRLKPTHFRANLLLGRLLGMQGDGAQALPYLREAAKIDPKSVEAHMFLANVYNQLGQMTNVQRERAEVERLNAGSKR
jgi:tetratricopeptide (TPR) repeat protein